MRSTKDIVFDNGVTLYDLIKIKAHRRSICETNKIDLREMDLRNVNFGCCDLTYTDFTRSDLTGCVFTGCNISHSIFTEANLNDAKFYDVIGHDCIFINSMCDFAAFDKSVMIGSDFTNAALRWASVVNVNLAFTKLKGSTFLGADITNTKFDLADIPDDLYHPLTCPEEGSFIGWKNAFIKTDSGKLNRGCVVKLKILEDSKRSSSTSRKCRCDKALVLDIITKDELLHYEEHYDIAVSYFNPDFIYKVGEIVSVPNFDTNRYHECAPGIHFYMTRREAEEE